MVANVMGHFCMAGSVATRSPLRRIPERVAVSFFASSSRFLWIGATDEADPTAASHVSSSSSSRSSKEKKQQSTHRLSSVIDAINERKLPPELRSRPNAIRSETDIVNVVEQRIWRSMEEGQFENLPGKGKPLDLPTNPHADPSEDTLYRILSRNGCAPEWVERNKEIRLGVASWRSALKKAWASREDCKNSTWTKDSEHLKLQMRDINNKILHYNLIVPYGRQMCGLKWEKEIEKLQ